MVSIIKTGVGMIIPLTPDYVRARVVTATYNIFKKEKKKHFFNN